MGSCSKVQLGRRGQTARLQPAAGAHPGAGGCQPLTLSSGWPAAAVPGGSAGAFGRGPSSTAAGRVSLGRLLRTGVLPVVPLAARPWASGCRVASQDAGRKRREEECALNTTLRGAQPEGTSRCHPPSRFFPGRGFRGCAWLQGAGKGRGREEERTSGAAGRALGKQSRDEQEPLTAGEA